MENGMTLHFLEARRGGAPVRAVVQASLWLLAAAVLPAGAATIDEWGPGAALELAPAPQRDVPQEALPSSPTARAAPSRAAVVARFRNEYVPQSAVPLGWTGNVSACQPGTTSEAHQQAVIGRINYYRALAGLPAAMRDTFVNGVQPAALIMSANAALSHSPPVSWACYTPAGAAGAGSANIALGLYGVGAIDAYMDDSGSNNAAVGHRRWLLY